MKDDRQIAKEFAEAIEHYMKKRDLTYQKLGEATGISPSYLCKIQQRIRRAPSVPIAVKIIKGLQIPQKHVLTLLELDEEEEEDVVDLYDVLLFETYSVNGIEVNLEQKKALIELIECVVSCRWDKGSMPSDFMAITQGIEQFKKAIK